MNLIKLIGLDLKRLLTNEIKISKDTPLKNIKTGEILKGEIIKQEENFLLVNLGKKGIIKAFSSLNSNISGKNVHLKVIKTSPSIVLKVLNKNYNIIKNLKEYNIDEILNKFPEIGKDLKFNDSDLSQSEKLKIKLKNLPEKLGLNFEKKILEENHISPDNLKAKILNELSSTSSHTNHHINQTLQYIENIQKINNEFFFFLPLFFENQHIEKGAIFFNNLQKNKNSDKNGFNIVLLLELSDNRVVQIDVFIIGKNISLTFLSNNKKFLTLLKEEFEQFNLKIENYNFKIVSTIFKEVSNLDFDENFDEFIKIDKNNNIVDIKT